MATSSELRKPGARIRSRRRVPARGRRSGVTPQASNCSSPRAARVSSNAGCAPFSSARSTDVASAWKYISSEMRRESRARLGRVEGQAHLEEDVLQAHEAEAHRAASGHSSARAGAIG